MISIVGGGFAGVEAAWAAAAQGLRVRLIEMRPQETTPAHETGWLAELVCSNSFKSKLPDSPAGQLKTEMSGLGSLVLQVAQTCEVPGGQALCVDRGRFGQRITEEIESHSNIEIERRTLEPGEIPTLASSGALILATGPLTTGPLSEWLATASGREHLYFYDAVSPTVEAASIDRSVVFAQSRYDKGGDDYLNCPFSEDDYRAFVRELVAAERVTPHAFEAGGKRDSSGGEAHGGLEEKIKYFAGCMPIEAIAEKGEKSLAFGNFKPVGLRDPRTGRRPFAVLQLRPENEQRTLYSLVACQTRLRWGEQRRVFRLVPGLESAEFVRYGVIHRNTYVEAPKVLTPDLRLKSDGRIRLAGQLTGVEGYIESAAMGILAGMAAAAEVAGIPFPLPPRPTALGSLLTHLQDPTDREFAPMNINWGLFPEPPGTHRDKGRRREAMLRAARESFAEWREAVSDGGRPSGGEG